MDVDTNRRISVKFFISPNIENPPAYDHFLCIHHVYRTGDVHVSRKASWIEPSAQELRGMAATYWLSGENADVCEALKDLALYFASVQISYEVSAMGRHPIGRVSSTERDKLVEALQNKFGPLLA